MRRKLFTAIGFQKVIFEREHLAGIISLITALVFFFVMLNLSKGKIRFTVRNDGLNIFFPVGFAYMVIGGSGFLSLGIWALGLTLFIVGLLFRPKSQEVFEKENAG